ncbi:hypothetical protein FRC04_010716, partial [Tulasnella sp. 424]
HHEGFVEDEKSSSAIADYAAGPSAASTSSAAAVSEATAESSRMSSRGVGKARWDRMKDAKEGDRWWKQQKGTKDDVDGMAAGAAPGSDEDLPDIHVAYHDWEHYSSTRNLTGPHQGVSNVREKPLPDEIALNKPSSLPPPQAQPAKSSNAIVVPAFYPDPLIQSPKKLQRPRTSLVKGARPVPLQQRT